MITVNFKFDNRDVVVVNGTSDAQTAFDAANDFLMELEDETSDYFANIFHEDFNESGSIEFSVKCYDK